MSAADEIRIRPARHDEADEVATVVIASRRANESTIPPSVHSDDEVRAWFGEHVMGTHDVRVACVGNTIRGVLVLSAGWIEHLYVHPESTGSGIGSALLATAKAAQERLDLWKFESNVGARRFYERHGFVAVDRTDGDNEEGAPDVRYRWVSPS